MRELVGVVILGDWAGTTNFAAQMDEIEVGSNFINFMDYMWSSGLS